MIDHPQAYDVTDEVIAEFAVGVDEESHFLLRDMNQFTARDPIKPPMNAPKRLSVFMLPPSAVPAGGV